MAGNSLQANQIAIQVVGNNIANADTPGYIQQNVVLQPGPTQTVDNLPLGSGVEVKGIQQQLDSFLEDRLRGAMSDQASTSTPGEHLHPARTDRQRPGQQQSQHRDDQFLLQHLRRAQQSAGCLHPEPGRAPGTDPGGHRQQHGAAGRLAATKPQSASRRHSRSDQPAYQRDRHAQRADRHVARRTGRARRSRRAARPAAHRPGKPRATDQRPGAE